MLRTLTARHDRFALSTPFRIARGVKTAADVVTVQIAQGDVVGRGEGVPYPRYGESMDGALADIERIRPLVERGGSRAALADAMPAGAARNALDAALWDLEARLAGSSVATLAGLPAPSPIASAITLGIDTPAAVAALAARHADVPLLKVKVDREAVAARLEAVRAAAPRPRLIVDPNESWTVADVADHGQLLRRLKVDLLEQPVPADADEGLADLPPGVPICADEALHTRADLPRLAGRYTHVNVKLDKTGGLTEAIALVAAAKQAGFGVMIGCMVATSLGIAPALLLTGEAAFVDLDGPLWLAEDRAGGVTDRGGWLMPSEPGFWGG